MCFRFIPGQGFKKNIIYYRKAYIWETNNNNKYTLYSYSLKHLNKTLSYFIIIVYFQYYPCQNGNF